MDTTFIYALCEPGTRTVRYIGKTKNLKKRFREHTCRSNDRTNHRKCWLYSILSEGLNPEMIVLKEASDLTWKEEEMRYIRAARALGMDLVNGTDGGDGCIESSPETRRKMSECKLGSKNPMFGKTGSANPAFGRPSPFKGVPRTEEVVEKMTRSAKRGAAHHAFGRPLTDQEKTNLSLFGKRGVKKAGSSSNFLGVCWQKSSGKWAVALCAEGRNFHLGLFVNEIDAAKAYDAAAFKRFGNLVPLNFPR